MQTLTALLAGLIFGIGLILSGMSNPSKVIGFLDLAGEWDPSLAFVMAGAILVGVFAFRFAATRSKAILGSPMPAPPERRIDRPLVLGALTFGVGWGLAGFCPAPAVVSIFMSGTKPVIFTIAMVIGMLVFEARRAVKVVNT